MQQIITQLWMWYIYDANVLLLFDMTYSTPWTKWNKKEILDLYIIIYFISGGYGVYIELLFVIPSIYILNYVISLPTTHFFQLFMYGFIRILFVYVKIYSLHFILYSNIIWNIRHFTSFKIFFVIFVNFTPIQLLMCIKYL